MPRRSTVPRTHGRRNSEEIEDTRSTQNTNAEDVSDDDQPRPSRVKKEKGKGKQRAPKPTLEEPDNGDDENDAMDEDSDDEDQIDVSNFPDQPLLREHLVRLKGIADDWDAMRRMIGQRGGIYKDVAAGMAEAGETDLKNSEALKQLDRGLKEFIDVGEEMKAHSEALNTIHQKIALGERIDNALEMYEQQVTQRVDAYASRTARQKYAKDETYFEFLSSIWEIANPDEGMPPITDLIEKEDNDDSDSDEDIQVGGVTQSVNCPLTLTLLENPVTSRICKHSFSRDSLQQFFRNANKENECPVTGCHKKFKLSDCVPDETLARKVKAYQRRQEALAGHSDAEEVPDDD